jgi:hypothetical protein
LANTNEKKFQISPGRKMISTGANPQRRKIDGRAGSGFAATAKRRKKMISKKLALIRLAKKGAQSTERQLKDPSRQKKCNYSSGVVVLHTHPWMEEGKNFGIPSIDPSVKKKGAGCCCCCCCPEKKMTDDISMVPAQFRLANKIKWRKKKKKRRKQMLRVIRSCHWW